MSGVLFRVQNYKKELKKKNDNEEFSPNLLILYIMFPFSLMAISRQRTVQEEESPTRHKIPTKRLFKRRTRGLQTPHAEMGNAARGDCQRRTRRLQCPYSLALFCPKQSAVG